MAAGHQKKKSNNCRLKLTQDAATDNAFLSLSKILHEIAMASSPKEQKAEKECLEDAANGE